MNTSGLNVSNSAFKHGNKNTEDYTLNRDDTLKRLEPFDFKMMSSLTLSKKKMAQ
jgi:hypothetical protein